jgi:hypothetical protein
MDYPTYIPKSTFWSCILSISHHLKFIDGSHLYMEPSLESLFLGKCMKNLEQILYQMLDKVSNLRRPNTKTYDAKKR